MIDACFRLELFASDVPAKLSLDLTPSGWRGETSSHDMASRSELISHQSTVQLWKNFEALYLPFCLSVSLGAELSISKSCFWDSQIVERLMFDDLALSGSANKCTRLSVPFPSYPGGRTNVSLIRIMSSLIPLNILSNLEILSSSIHSPSGIIHLRYSRACECEIRYTPCFLMNKSHRKHADLLDPIHLGGRAAGYRS